MAGLLAWLRSFLRLASTLLVVWISFAATRAGCGGGNPATRPAPAHGLWWVRRHLDKLDDVHRRATSIQLVFVGDSITQDYERTDPDFNFKPIWDELFASRGALNLGTNADRTEHILWRLRHGEVDGLSPRDVVLLVGANNLNFPSDSPRFQSVAQIAEGTLAVIAELHTRLPAAHILVLSILPTGFPGDRNLRAIAINAHVQSAIQPLPYAHYLDVTPLFLDGERFRTELFCESMHDPSKPGLHPNPQGQRLMAEAVVHALYAN